MSKSKSDDRTRLGITPGEPAGIGPDICLASHTEASRLADLIFFADPGMLATRARALNIDIQLNNLAEGPFQPGTMNIQPVNIRHPVEPGVGDPRNAPYVIETLDAAVKACISGDISGMVTGPINKGLINDGGIPFSGHTEWLAEQTSTDRVVMMLAAGNLRVALATTHLPLHKVPSAITREVIIETLTITHHDLQQRFGIKSPHILVCGLNPHAGESGHLGTEEIETIAPAIEQLRSAGMHLTGPLPADTAFTPRSLETADAVLAMFHDQGLPVLKHAGFGEAVNITLGLPILRTSVDHGTAFDLAGTGKAESSSLLAAIACAAELA